MRFFLENCKDSLKTNLVRDTSDNYKKIQYHFFDKYTNKENLVNNFISESQKTQKNRANLREKIMSLSTPTPNETSIQNIPNKGITNKNKTSDDTVETRKTWILISLLGLSVGSGIFLYIYTPKDKRKNLTDQPGRIMAVTIFAPMLIYKSWKYRDIEVGMFGSILWLWDMYWLIKRKPQKNHIITSNGVISKYDFPID